MTVMTSKPSIRTVWNRLQFSLSVTGVSLFAAAFMAVVGNAALWQSVLTLMPLSFANFGFLLAEAVFLLATIHLFIAPFALRWLLKPVLIVLFFSTASAAYFMDAYGTIIDSSMIQNVVETDVKEATELLTLRLVVYLLLFGLLPSLLLLRTTIRFPTLAKALLGRVIAIVLTVAAIAGAIASHYKDFSLIGREHKELRMLMNPVYPIYAVGQFLFASEAGPAVIEKIGEDATRARAASGHERKMLVFFVVGETARAANFSLNGYDRETNPELATLPLLNFKTTYSCGTTTAISVRCMFSNLGRDNFNRDKADAREGVLDVLQRAGVAVLWRDNNSGCKGACDRVANEALDTLQLPELCHDGECFDDVLLHQLQDKLDAATTDTFIVMHQKGSHGPAYYKRTPAEFKRFLPECTDANVQNCDRQSIINAYDNTLLYTDHILASLIAVLQKNAANFDTAFVYVSDHGESLGENNLYLHGFPYAIAPEEQKRVPLLMWFSPGIESRLGLDRACLQKRAEQPASHDNLFHSFLGLFDVRTSVYKAELDLFAGCRTSPVP
ncbi:phosphoethanolamine--lipid A transferase [Permianibacter sp. IMCC34836]|uniref:phosphoethanolamine transferase n=1 Tax=Permianibacter fluminis TaxID=2738515 RepID=UPI0015529C77|nr:phosphoethanolamine--lipid A transferase [Permianibacter fluminis]NQD38694.1 phosphoethanolamine--lipid A transferase [Permianibacter fluminis]